VYTCITCRCGLLLVLHTTMHMHACRLVGSCWHCQLNSCERSTRSVAATLASSGHPSRSTVPFIHRPADRSESQAAQHYLAGACCPLVGPGHYSSQPRKRHAARPPCAGRLAYYCTDVHATVYRHVVYHLISLGVRNIFLKLRGLRCTT
jgi:hypothetical protein